MGRGGFIYRHCTHLWHWIMQMLAKIRVHWYRGHRCGFLWEFWCRAIARKLDHSSTSQGARTSPSSAPSLHFLCYGLLPSPHGQLVNSVLTGSWSGPSVNKRGTRVVSSSSTLWILMCASIVPRLRPTGDLEEEAFCSVVKLFACKIFKIQ